MKAWLHRNILALIVIGLVFTIYASTITYPAWRDSKWLLNPLMTVPAGSPTTIDGTQWHMETLDIPAPYRDSEVKPLPRGMRLASYALENNSTDKPGTFDDSRLCNAELVDSEGRRWPLDFRNLPDLTVQWLIDHNYFPVCRLNLPFAAVVAVPADAKIVSVNILLFTDHRWKSLARFMVPS